MFVCYVMDKRDTVVALIVGFKVNYHLMCLMNSVIVSVYSVLPSFLPSFLISISGHLALF